MLSPRLVVLALNPFEYMLGAFPGLGRGRSFSLGSLPPVPMFFGLENSFILLLSPFSLRASRPLSLSSSIDAKLVSPGLSWPVVWGCAAVLAAAAAATNVGLLLEP